MFSPSLDFNLNAGNVIVELQIIPTGSYLSFVCFKSLRTFKNLHRVEKKNLLCPNSSTNILNVQSYFYAFREALELTASLAGPAQAEALPTEHRKDQNPTNFGK